MSRRKRAPAAPPAAIPDGPPFVGGLLRIAMGKSRAHVEQAMHDADFHDLPAANFPAFAYPLPDGMRPSDFARHRGISRQAANHLLGQMEALGYFERRAAKAGGRRLIYLTRRGERVAETIYAALRELQKQWAAKVGPERFALFMEVLRELAEVPDRTGNPTIRPGLPHRRTGK